jgi:hypothetical protein
MSEKQSTFTVTDRRKFTLDGELRDPSRAEETHHATPAPRTPAQIEIAQEIPAATPGATTPAGRAEGIDPDPLEPGLDADARYGAASNGDGFSDGNLDQAADDDFDEELGPVPTSQETAAQHAAYQQSSVHLDAMIREANPGAAVAPQIDFEQVVQSFYLSAAIAMGAAAEPGQKPRVDIVGARQSIDMLAVLVDKTRGNLTEREQKLLQTALFNLRMMFLEITNSIAAQASRAPRPGGPR